MWWAFCSAPMCWRDYVWSWQPGGGECREHPPDSHGRWTRPFPALHRSSHVEVISGAQCSVNTSPHHVFILHVNIRYCVQRGADLPSLPSCLLLCFHDNCLWQHTQKSQPHQCVWNLWHDIVYIASHYLAGFEDVLSQNWILVCELESSGLRKASLGED